MKRFRWLPSDGGATGNLVALLLGGVTGAGLLIGGLLGLLGGVDLIGEPAQVAATATASFYDCPDGDPLGNVTRGDRVFITGRDASGAWVQVRSPAAVDSRAWMRAAHVLPDSSLDEFPVLPCGVPVVAEVAVATTVTTEAPDTTGSTEAPDTTGSTEAPPATDATVPPAAPPSVSAVSAKPSPIWESYFGEPICNSNSSLPSVTTISATVSAPAGVQSVTMAWQVGGVSGSTPMTQAGGQYQAALGPFDAEDPNLVPSGETLPATVTVSVTDTLGRSASASTAVILSDCTFG